MSDNERDPQSNTTSNDHAPSRWKGTGFMGKKAWDAIQSGEIVPGVASTYPGVEEVEIQTDHPTVEFELKRIKGK